MMMMMMMMMNTKRSLVKLKKPDIIYDRSDWLLPMSLRLAVCRVLFIH